MSVPSLGAKLGLRRVIRREVARFAQRNQLVLAVAGLIDIILAERERREAPQLFDVVHLGCAAVEAFCLAVRAFVVRLRQNLRAQLKPRGGGVELNKRFIAQALTDIILNVIERKYHDEK